MLGHCDPNIKLTLPFETSSGLGYYFLSDYPNMNSKKSLAAIPDSPEKIGIDCPTFPKKKKNASLLRQRHKVMDSTNPNENIWISQTSYRGQHSSHSARPTTGIDQEHYPRSWF